jgi:hypothetical protein
MFKKQGTSKRSASTSIGDIKPGFHEATTPTDMGEKASACDMAWAFEELELCEELSEVQLATVVGGWRELWWEPPFGGTDWYVFDLWVRGGQQWRDYLHKNPPVSVAHKSLERVESVVGRLSIEQR